MRKNKPLFVSFEGPEASGKSSQIILLKNLIDSIRLLGLATFFPVIFSNHLSSKIL